MFIIKVLSGVAFLGSVVWFLALPGYNSFIAIVTSLAAFIAAIIGNKNSRGQWTQSQTVDENGIGIQAGGDVHTGSIRTSRKARDAK